MYDWGYDTEPEERMDGRRIEVARGKVVGGSSSINAMAYVRGNRADYDRWASRGLPDWSYEKVLPYFRKQESWEGGASAYRGGNGPFGDAQGALSGPAGRCLSRRLRRKWATRSTTITTARAGWLCTDADDDPRTAGARAPPQAICIRCCRAKT